MAADEQQAKDVVAIVGAVEALCQGGFRIVQIGDQRLVRKRLLLAAPAHVVDGGIAPDHDQPGRRVPRRPVLRPGLQSPQAGVLERFLGRIQVAEIAQQRAQRLGPRGGQGRSDPGGVGHVTFAPGRNSRTGLIS